MAGATLEERTIRDKVAGKRLAYRYRWFKQAPLRDGADAMLVDWIHVTITDATGKITDDSAFVTSLDVTQDSVAAIVHRPKSPHRSPVEPNRHGPLRIAGPSEQTGLDARPLLPDAPLQPVRSSQ